MVEFSWVKDASVTGSKRLAECTDLIDPEDIGEPTYFVRYVLNS